MLTKFLRAASANNETGFGLSLVYSSLSTADASTYTFSNATLGNANSTREIFVLVNALNQSGSSRSISSITVAGSSATLDSTQYNTSGGGTNGIARISLASGTTGDIVVNFAGGMLDCAVFVYRVVNRINAGTASSARNSNTSASAPISTSLTVPSGDFVLAIFGSTANSSVTSTSPTNFVLGAQTAAEAALSYQFGAGSSVTFTVNYSPNTSSRLSVWAYQE